MRPLFAKSPKSKVSGDSVSGRGILVTVLFYASFAALWILFSDRLMSALVTDHDTLLAVSIVKGFFYVAVTSLLLYWVLRRTTDASLLCRDESAGRRLGFVTWPPWSLYGAAIFLSLATVFVRQGINVSFADSPLLILLVLPVTISAALGGFGPGLVATMLVAAVSAWFIPPDGSLVISAVHDIVQWEMLIANGLLISLVCEIMLRARQRETDRWQQLLAAQESLQESEARYRELFESNPHPMWIYDIETLAFLSVNNAAVAHYGYSREKFLAMTIKDIRPLEDVPRLMENVAGIRGGLDDAGTWRHRREDGSIIDVEITSHTLQYNERPAELILAHDVTERKRAEEALARSENKFRSLFENHAAVKLIIDPESGAIVDANNAAARFYGWSVEELCGKKISQINILPPEKIKEEIEKARGLQNTHFEFNHRKADGAVVDVEVFSSKVEIDGKEYLHSIIHDITEKRQLEKQLLQAQKMESVGRLAGGVAHDFNNMLGVILGNAEMALNKVSPTDPLHRDLMDILSAARKSAEITRQLLAFARKQTISPRVIDLNGTVEGMLKILRRLIGEEIDLAWLPGSGIWPVMADPSQIDQILANLCVNARDAIVGVGKITIETANVTFDEAHYADHPGFMPGDFVLLAVSDDGCGMEKGTVDHVFEPFFTTKEIGRGTGLGLATVYGIVKQNKGFISVYSEPEKSTTFKIYLPRQAGEAGLPEVRGAKELPAGNGDTVLLVEDEVSLLALTRRILAELGYAVLDAETPEKALALAREHAGRIDLLLTDVVMPEMNGRELAGRLKATSPELKVLYMSGYTANVIAHHGVLETGVHFIPKPFTKKELSGKVREVLGQD